MVESSVCLGRAFRNRWLKGVDLRVLRDIQDAIVLEFSRVAGTGFACLFVYLTIL
jgi:hypothetical protein